MKLQLIKYLNRAGVPHALSLIRNGHVQVRNKIIRNPVYQIKNSYEVLVDGEEISVHHEYVLLDKTKGTSCQKGERVPYVGVDYPNLFVVGRLDYNTTGMLLLTNDGAFAKTVLGSSVTKTYLVTHEGILTDNAKRQLESGMIYEIKNIVYTAQPARVHFVFDTQTLILINEGQHRQVRGMFEQIGNPVTDLRRVAIGTANKAGKINPGTLSQPVTEDLIRKWLQELRGHTL